MTDSEARTSGREMSHATGEGIEPVTNYGMNVDEGLVTPRADTVHLSHATGKGSGEQSTESSTGIEMPHGTVRSEGSFDDSDRTDNVQVSTGHEAPVVADPDGHTEGLPDFITQD